MKRLYYTLGVLSITCILWAGSFTVHEFLGVSTTENKFLLAESKSPDMDNMDLSEGGVTVKRRDGHKWAFETSLTSYSVTAKGETKNATYDKLILGFGDRVVAYDAAFNATILHSSATIGYSWDFAKWKGNTYASNGTDTVFYTDGNTKTFITSAPKGKSIIFYNDTCFIANPGGANRCRIYYSKYSDATDWTTGINPTDGRSFDVADWGEEVVDLEVNGNAIGVLASKSILKIVGTENPYQVIEVDKSIGCKSKGSVVTVLGKTYFYGSDGQYYVTDFNTVECISDKEFYDAFNGLATTGRDSLFASLTTKIDFDTCTSSHVSTNITSGDIRCSSFTQVYTSTTDWNSWTLTSVDSTTIPGDLALSTLGYLDQFSDGDYTSAPAWTTVGGTWVVDSDAECLYITATTDSEDIYTPITSCGRVKNLDMRLDVKFTGSTATSRYATIYFYTNTAKSQYARVILRNLSESSNSNTYGTFKIEPGITADETLLWSESVAAYHTIRFIQSDDNSFGLYVDGLPKTAISTTTYATDSAINFWISANPISGTWFFDNINFGNMYAKTATAISPVVDTTSEDAFNLVYGDLNAGIVALPTGTTIQYYVRTSSVSNMGNSTYVELPGANSTAILGVTDYRYIQFKSTFSTSNIVVTPDIGYVQLSWATTGYFYSPYILMLGVNSFGKFEANDSGDDTDNTVTYYIATSSYVVASSSLSTSASWIQVTGDSIITATINTYAYLKAVFDIQSGTSTLAVNDMTVNWYSGSSNTNDLTACWYKNKVYVGVPQTLSSSSNDAIFVYDPDLQCWWSYKSGIYPNNLFTWKNKFYVASATSGVVATMLDGDKDLGSDIDCYWTSKYLTGVGGISPNSSDLLYYTLLYSSQTTGSFKIDWMLNGNTTSALTEAYDMTTGNAITFYTGRFPENFNAKYWQFKLYNYEGSNLEFHGILGQTLELPFSFKEAQ